MSEVVAETQLRIFISHCEQQTGRIFADYGEFETFTMTDFRTFWGLFLEWSEISHEGDASQVCDSDDCEKAKFFPSLRLNYAENILRNPERTHGPALIGYHADGSYKSLSWDELHDDVIQFANYLQLLGIEPGDRVAAIARNNIEVIIAALGTAAIGAVFTSCSFDMGTATILSRFQILAPKILVANCANKPGDVGKPLDERIDEVIAALPSLTTVIAIDGMPGITLPHKTQVVAFKRTIEKRPTNFTWKRFPFDHPLFILFSSGTTGTPKCIIHGAGGTLLEHVKEHRLHGDLNANDRMFFQTSCGWMMWNWQLSALACNAQVIVYDGPLMGPHTLWEIVSELQATVFGTNPAYLQFTEDSGYTPHVLPLSSLRSVLSTGSILYPKQFDWILQNVKDDVAVQSISGGTDILGCFVLGNPLLPVYRGKAQCRSLGIDVRSFPPEDQIGELVCVNPFPSRPIGFFGETSNDRYHNTYYEQNPGVWTHGDLIEITSEGAVMHGRSDGIMNIRGVRIGPAEIYRILQGIPSIVEAMAIEQTDEKEAGGTRLVLLVVLRGGVPLDNDLIIRIRTMLIEQGNAMMVPSIIIDVKELPVTHSGKRSEAAARDVLNGKELRNRGALLNPDCLDGLFAKTQAYTVISEAIDDDLEKTLCAICRQYLKVPVVRPNDNFLTMGGDSLTILSFLMDASARSNTTVPLPALIGVATIKDLTTLLVTGKKTGVYNINETAAKIRAVEPNDNNEIYALLDTGFRRKLPWQRILEHPWQSDTMPRGFVITADDAIVGFLGLICSERTLNGKSDIIGNLSSWYVKPEFRGWSNSLIATATQFDITYTSLTPSRASQRILAAMGFTALDKATFWTVPWKSFGGKPNEIIVDPVIIRQRIGDTERQIMDDHARYESLPILIIDDNESAFVLVTRRSYRHSNITLWPYSLVLYCSAPHILDRYLHRVASVVTRRQRTIGLALSEHMTQDGIKIPCHTMMRSKTFVAGEMDKLYSELVLLPI